jgi:hypothetical protein
MGAIAGAWIGQILAIIVWIVVASVDQGAVNVTTLGTLNCQMGGCITAIVASGLIHTLASLAAPQNYDWKSMGEIKMLEDDQRGLAPEEFEVETLSKALSWVKAYGFGFTFLMVIVWPVLSLPAGVFTKGYWAMWVFISLAWGFVASFVIIALPLYESMDSILGVAFALVGMKYKPVDELKKPAKAPESEPAKAVEPAPQAAKEDDVEQTV